MTTANVRLGNALHDFGSLADGPLASALYDFEASLARRLLAWGVVSVAGGAVLGVVGASTGDRTLRAFGSQTIGWGAIDAGLALAGRLRARRLVARPPADPAATSREATRVRRILAVNAGLDVVYVVGGLGVAVGRGRYDPSARGHGLAAVLQGTFLLGFDAWHAARVPDAGGAPAATLGFAMSRAARVPDAGGAPAASAGRMEMSPEAARGERA